MRAEFVVLLTIGLQIVHRTKVAIITTIHRKVERPVVETKERKTKEKGKRKTGQQMKCQRIVGH